MTTTRQPSGEQTAKIRIHDWDKWQTYRKDRGTPPWVKVHRCVMTCHKWATLSDAEKGQLVSLWIVAADKDGELPADPRILRKVCQLDELPDLSKFQQLKLIDLVGCQVDAKLTPDGFHNDAPEERRGEEIINNMSGKPSDVQVVFSYWQEKMNHPRAVLIGKRERAIKNSLKTYTVDQLKKAVDGCLNSPHHMGQNEQGQKYDDIELICRDATKTDKFIELASKGRVIQMGGYTFD